MITYCATLDVPRELAGVLARLLHQQRRGKGTRRGRRALSCYRQAVLIIRWFVDATAVARLARDHRISLSTAYRYLHEGIDVLAAAAPDLHHALAVARAHHLPYLVLDGTLIATHRVGARTEKGTHLWYSGKHRTQGGNIQYLATPDGTPLWTSQVSPGSTHDLTAARQLCLPALYAATIPTLADKGYRGAGIGIHTPVLKSWGNQHILHVDNRTTNRLITGLRCRGERAMAQLKTRWKALHNVTLCPWRIGDIVAAALVLTHLETIHKTTY